MPGAGRLRPVCVFRLPRRMRPSRWFWMGAKSAFRSCGGRPNRGSRGSRNRRLHSSAQPRLEELFVLYACLELGAPCFFCTRAGRRAKVDTLLLLRWRRESLRIRLAVIFQTNPERFSRIVPETQDQVVLTTSGTTGPPKLVPLSRDNLLAAVESHALNLPSKRRNRWLLALPFAHIGGLSILLRSLWARTTVIAQSKGDPWPRNPAEPNLSAFSGSHSALWSSERSSSVTQRSSNSRGGRESTAHLRSRRR